MHSTFVQRLIIVIFQITLLFQNVPSYGLDVPLTIANRDSMARDREPITSGVPFAQGVLKNPGSVRLLLNGVEIPAQFLPTAYWPDKSIRWLLSDFQINLTASGTSTVTLQTGVEPIPVSGIIVGDQANQLTINTRVSTFAFNKKEFTVNGSGFEVSSGGSSYRAVPASNGWMIEEQGPMKVVIRVDGNWNRTLSNSLNRFRARLIFYRDKSEIRIFLTFRNNNSYGWNPEGPPGKPDLILTGARFGIDLLKPGTHYVFGSGVEKTWELIMPLNGRPVVVDSRYAGNGSVAPGYTTPRPLAASSPDYYSSTNAWGPIVPALSGFPAGQQADFNLFEKLQRAKVIQSDVENLPGQPGITLWKYLYQDIKSWHDYGDLRWGGDFGSLSGNHYDWSYGMYLQFMRTGRLAFADAARVFARHEIDMDIYHTGADGEAYNYQKNWESRPTHDNPGNEFGCGRPSHTWSSGYALHWLISGDPRGRDGYEEILEGVRQYAYESFNGEGYIDTSEIRIAGWLTENLITLYRVNPDARLKTKSYGTKTVPLAIKDILKAVFDREAKAGKHGYVYAGDPPDPNTRHPLMNCYFLEPAIHAYDEVFKGRDKAYAAKLLGLIRRMTDWLISITYGGDNNGSGLYRPRQIPMWIDITQPGQREGQIPYLLMAANAAGFCYKATGEASYRDYAQNAFQDYIRYLGVTGGDTYINPKLRTPTCYNSNVYVDTESKIHGWSSRYGQYYFAAIRKAIR